MRSGPMTPKSVGVLTRQSQRILREIDCGDLEFRAFQGQGNRQNTAPGANIHQAVCGLVTFCELL